MKERTIIMQKWKKIIQHPYYLSVKKAITLGRANGLQERLEIQHWYGENDEEVMISLYSINQDDKIVGAIFPCLHLVRHLVFEEIL